jgi:phospholipid/cholesterol/gamma-HCH transport system substrate-binding protein
VKRVVTPFRVGLLVILAGAILFFFLTFIRKGGLRDSESLRVVATFKDASGLTRRSKVQIAGIPVGEIERIQLEGLKARVYLKVRNDVEVRQNASVTKRSESLLGDYMIDLNPGTEDSPKMENGGEITRVADAQGMEQLMGSLQLITSDVQAVTQSLRNVLGGAQGQGSLEAIVQNMVKLTEAVERTIRDSAVKLDAILSNVEVVSGDVRRLTGREQASIGTIVDNLTAISQDVREVVSSVKRVVGENEGDVKGEMSSLKSTITRLDHTLANVEAVTESVRKGEGAAGALLSDQKLGQKVADTVGDVADFASRLTQLEIEVGMKADYMVVDNSAKTFLSLRLIPKPDKYYLIEAIDDPRGSIQTVYVEQNPPSAGSPAVQKQTTTTQSYKISAEFAKRYSFLTLRFGLIESTGGLGVDLNLPLKYFWYPRWLEDALVLKVDAFNFSLEGLRFPRLRATLRFTPFEHVYVNAGVDDVLNAPNHDTLTNRLISGRDFFFGGGIYFNDSDLTAILPVIPKP